MNKLIALLLLVPALAFGNEQMQQGELAYYDGYGQNANCCYPNDCVYNCSFNNSDCGRNNCLCFPWEIFITADFLYWKPFQGGMEFADSYAVSTVTSLNDARSIFIDPEWKPGFRIGVGVFNCNCPLDVSLYYTRLRFKEDNSASGTLFPVLNFPAGLFVTEVAFAEAEWDFHFQNLDLDIGYFLCNRPFLVVHPYLGLKTAWIDQDFDVIYGGGPTIPTGTLAVAIENDFWGIGPKIGLEVEWYSLPCLYVFGNFAAAILWGEFDNNQTQNQDTIINQINLTDKFDMIVPTIQTVIGVGYQQNVNLCNCRFNLGLRVAAEAQYWWDIYQRQIFTANVGPVHHLDPTNLGLIGLTVTGRIGF